jgi:dihydrofolate reductase
MRKLIVSVLMSLNGVIGNPHEWAHEFGAESAAEAKRQLDRSHALLMGRRTYEIFSTLWPDGAGDYAAAVNSLRKYVFSSSLETADWTNSILIAKDPAAAVAELKREGDDDLVMYGYGQLGRYLRENNLIDELKVWIFPRFVPTGTLMFHEGEIATLELVDTTTTPNGIVIAAYCPRADAE